MKYISLNEYASKYGVSERTARNYCAAGKIEGIQFLLFFYALHRIVRSVINYNDFNILF